MVVSPIQKYKAVCWQTRKYLYIHKACTHQSYRMEQVKGLHTTPCTVAAGISHTVRRQENRTALSGYGDSFQGHPSYSQNAPRVPNSSGGLGGGNQAVRFPSCHYLYPIDQAYHRHYTKTSNNCTKNKATVIDKNKKQKPTTKPLGTLHCVCRSPQTLK